MNKKKHGEEEHIDETWLIPYADLLTLLLALFIVLFASSNLDKSKMAAIAESFYKEYNGNPPATLASGSDPGEMPSVPDILPEPDIEESGDIAELYNTLVTLLQDELESYVESEGLDDEMRIEMKEDGILITLTSDVWFPSGSAEINAPQKEIASRVSQMLAAVQDEHQVKLSVIVSGHTDNVPVGSGSEYDNNWQLSVTRAVNFMEELMNASTLQPSNFSARGFGEFEPIDTNDTPEGRQRNRRVEVLITPDTAAAQDNVQGAASQP